VPGAAQGRARGRQRRGDADQRAGVRVRRALSLSTEGRVYAPSSGEDEPKVLYPLAFCRECGQETYLVARVASNDSAPLKPVWRFETLGGRVPPIRTSTSFELV
jgi:hypothetical protein